MSDGADNPDQPFQERQPFLERVTQPGRPLGPFRYPAFRAIWTANLLSQFGSLIQSAAAAWLMTELTKSHQLIAAVGASTTFPVMLIGLFAGALADSYDRRRVMLAAQWVMLVPSAVLAVLTWQGAVTPTSLLVCTFAVGAGFALNGPAWQASVRAQVGPQDISQAISLNTIAFNVARSVGPAIGGLLIAVAGMAASFGINAASYVMLIVVLLRWRPEIAPPVRRPLLRSIREGTKFCWDSVPIRRILLRGLCVGIGCGAFQPLLPAMVRDLLHESEFFYGLTLGLFGLGSIVAAIFVADLRRRIGGEATIAIGTASQVAVFPLIPLLVPFTGSAWPLLGLAFVAGIGWVLIMTTVNVAIQLRAPEQLLGRALSMYQAITLGGMAIGAWFWGFVADISSLPAALYSAAAFLAVVTLVLGRIAPMPRPDEGRVDMGAPAAPSGTGALNG